MERTILALPANLIVIDIPPDGYGCDMESNHAGCFCPNPAIVDFSLTINGEDIDDGVYTCADCIDAKLAEVIKREFPDGVMVTIVDTHDAGSRRDNLPADVLARVHILDAFE